MLSPKDSPQGKLLSQYVCARIIRMDNIDVALFDRDWNNAVYFFVMNSDEQIYMRYGGRNSTSPDTYLNLASLELALDKGLELHQRHLKGELKQVDRPRPLFPREIPLLVERTLARHACVECHLIGDYLNVQRERDGTLDKPTHMYRSPDIATIGISLDVPKGLVVKEVRDAASAAGMSPGDRISKLNGTPVWTFGDLQYYYDKVPRNAKEIGITVERSGSPIDLSIILPARWWWTDLTFRQFTIDPRVFFRSRPLTDPEKRRYEVDPNGFASEVTHVDMYAEMTKLHQLRVGDIIFGVDGKERDEIANTAEFFIKLRKTAGQSVILGVIRDGKRIEMNLRTSRVSFRK